MKLKSKKLNKGIYKTIVVATFIVIVWILLTMVFKLVAAIFIPSPVDLANSFVKLAPGLPSSILASIFITMSGFGIGIAAGVFIGMMMAYSKGFMQTIGPFMEVTRPVPVFALIPLFMLWFGLGLWPQILLIALGVSAILGVQTYEAIRNMPIVYIRAAFNLGASKQAIFRTVVMPYIFPHLVGAIRVAAATSWGLDVAAEFMGVQVGLGYTMIVQQMYLNTSGIIVIILIYSAMAIVLDQVIRKIEKRVTHWTDREALSFDGLN